MEGSLALDGIATSAPYNYSALDPKSMEERGVEQFRRKPKFQYVRFMIVPSTIIEYRGTEYGHVHGGACSCTGHRLFYCRGRSWSRRGVQRQRAVRAWRTYPAARGAQQQQLLVAALGGQDVMM